MPRSSIARPSGTAIALLVSAIVAVGAAAQGTPTSELGEAVDPALCRVDPRPLSFYEQFIGTPGPEEALAESATPRAVPEGEPAEDAVVAEVIALEREIVACINTGDVRRIDALKTDEALQRQYGARPFSREVFDNVFAATPTPPLSPYRLVGVRDVLVLADGRVGAYVDYSVPTEAGVTDNYVLVTDFQIYRQVDGRYLLDDVIEDPPPPAGTPEARAA